MVTVEATEQPARVNKQQGDFEMNVYKAWVSSKVQTFNRKPSNPVFFQAENKDDADRKAWSLKTPRENQVVNVSFVRTIR